MTPTEPVAARTAGASPDTLVNGVAVLPDGARVVVLIVGLETYRSSGAQQIESVEFAEADARAFQHAVETVFAAHRPEVRVLINDNATHADVVTAIKDQAYGLGPDDLFIFYYAGHGFHDDSGNRLTVWETSTLNIAGTTVGVREHLLGPLERSQCQRVLAFVDACATRFKPLGRRIITALDHAEFGELLRSASFNAVFLSCRPGEQSYPDRDLGHGVWTHYLLRALNGQAPEAVAPGGFITNATLQDYLRQEVPRHLANHSRIKATQTPEIMMTTTNTFAICKVLEAGATAPAAPAPAVVPAPAPDHARYGGSSTEFFARRFARAFPGLGTIEWFDNPAAIRIRLLRLLEPPLTFKQATPIWWWRDGNMHIEEFSIQANGHYLMDVTELDIQRIAAVPGRSCWQSFVYVETAGLPPSGAYKALPDKSKETIETFGYDFEEYGLVDGKHVVTRGEYDDKAGTINGELQDFPGRAELRVRHLTPYNFLIAANGSPVNNPKFDQTLEDHLNKILKTGEGLEDLAKEIRKLPRPPHSDRD